MPKQDGASLRNGAGELSNSPRVSGATPLNIDVWTGRVDGGLRVLQRKHDAPSSARVVRVGIVVRLMCRGASPSIETTSTGERETVVPSEYVSRIQESGIPGRTRRR